MTYKGNEKSWLLPGGEAEKLFSRASPECSEISSQKPVGVVTENTSIAAKKTDNHKCHEAVASCN